MGNWGRRRARGRGGGRGGRGRRRPGQAGNGEPRPGRGRGEGGAGGGRGRGQRRGRGGRKARRLSAPAGVDGARGSGARARCPPSSPAALIGEWDGPDGGGAWVRRRVCRMRAQLRFGPARPRGADVACSGRGSGGRSAPGAAARRCPRANGGGSRPAGPSARGRQLDLCAPGLQAIGPSPAGSPCPSPSGSPAHRLG